MKGGTPAPTALLPVCRFIGNVCCGSELATFCPFRCAVTMETGTFVGTTEMAMPGPGALMRDRGFVVPTGHVLTRFCGDREDPLLQDWNQWPSWF